MTTLHADLELVARREGVLSAVGHDLRFVLPNVEAVLDERARTLDATLDLNAIELVGALDANGAARPVSERDRRDILDNLATKVLGVKRHPEARFSASDVALDAPSLRGTLLLAGVARPVELRLARAGEERAWTTTLHQPDFGIAPFSAMLGALKVCPDVEVRIRFLSSENGTL